LERFHDAAEKRSAPGGDLLGDSCYVLQPPGGTASGPVTSVVQRGSNPSQRVAALAQPPDFVEHCLLGRIRLDVLPVGAQAIAKLDIAHTLAFGALVAHSVPGTYYSYLNFGYCILEEVFHQVSGVPYDVYLKANVTGPIGNNRAAVSRMV
jgi:hypothetical protein